VTHTSQILRSKREAAGFSRARLAELVGVSERQIARYEGGAHPTLPVAQRIAEALGCSLDDLVDGVAVA
jgi:transcriptional regulator with XRE-family HTH domain